MAEQQDRCVIQRHHESPETRIGSLRHLGDRGLSEHLGVREVVQVGALHLVQTARSRERAEHVARPVGLAPSLDAAVAVGAQPGEHRQLVSAQTRHAASARECLHPGSGGRQAVAGSTVGRHTVDGCRRSCELPGSAVTSRTRTSRGCE